MPHDVLGAISLSIIVAAVFALVARRIRQPLILGYILGGAVLGAHVGFGVITDEASIGLISEIGLILLLFIIGLEINIPRLAQAGRTIAVTGLLQLPICAGLAWLAFGGIAASTGGPLDRLYLAVTLSLSSTLIVVKLLFDKFEMNTFGGRVTLGILVIQDVWAIVFLALQPSLQHLQPAPLLRSVAVAAMLSRFVLPALFRAIATSVELMLITSVAWCFLVAGAAGWAGLSKEMGALIAGMAIAAFPYGTEVISRLSGVRDFFITLFFVALGLKIPEPSVHLLLVSLGTAVFVVLSRFLAVFPIFACLRLDTRTAGVVAINLAQISEFSLVIVTLGSGYQHVSSGVVSLVLYTLLITSVISTYGILFNHQLASAVARFLAVIGVPRWFGATTHDRREERSDVTRGERDVFLLGSSREGLSLLQRLERELPAMKRRIVAIDFNPDTLQRLQAEGVECHYGDIGNIETLRHAGMDKAAVVVSSISDWFLKGTNNLQLLRLARALAPSARVVVTADTLAGAEQLYAEGADYVLIPPALTAAQLHLLLRDGSPDALQKARRRQAAELFGRST
jgi:Kef-type K+ transport system membrane component KefB